MRGDRKCRPAVRRTVWRPHMRFDLSLQTMMSSRIHPKARLPQDWGGPDRPFNSRCQIAAAGWAGTETRFSAIAWRRLDGGVRRDRTDDLMLAKHALYQLSYDPSSKRGRLGWEPRSQGSSSICLSARGVTRSVVGPGRLELPTSRLSGVCSNQLSYRPLKRSAQTPAP
jgi:hypothetical protein